METDAMAGKTGVMSLHVRVERDLNRDLNLGSVVARLRSRFAPVMRNLGVIQLLGGGR